jgi:hypothetical protein
MSAKLNSLARSVLPQRYRPEEYLTELVRKRTAMVVAAGSFAGLMLPLGAREALVPKLLGIYERELAPIIQQVVRLGFARIINVGAAEGYYAVGLARSIPDAAVHAFDMDECALLLLRETTAANGVAGRVAIQGKCEPDNLRDCMALGGKIIVICDVEGYESVLLDTKLVPQLTRSHILVELHELHYQGITELLRTRFERSHRIEQIWVEQRSAKDFPFQTFYTRLFPGRFLHNIVNEWRSDDQSWLWMQPRKASDPA